MLTLINGSRFQVALLYRLFGRFKITSIGINISMFLVNYINTDSEIY